MLDLQFESKRVVGGDLVNDHNSASQFFFKSCAIDEKKSSRE